MDHYPALKQITKALEELTNITAGVQQLEANELYNNAEEIPIMYRREIARLSLYAAELEHVLHLNKRKFGKPYILGFDETRLK